MWNSRLHDFHYASFEFENFRDFRDYHLEF